MLRTVNNGIMGSQGVANFFNTSVNQDNLISLMNKNSSKKQDLVFTPTINIPMASAGNINSDKGVYDAKTGAWSSSG